MRIDRSGMAAVVLQRIRRGRRPSMSEFHVLAGATVALVAVMTFAGPASARPVSGTDVPQVPTERTEGEKYAGNYGFGSDETVVSVERTEGEKYAGNYGFGSDETVVSVERTEGEKYAGNYGFAVLDGRLADAARLQAQADFFLAMRHDPAITIAHRAPNELPKVGLVSERTPEELAHQQALLRAAHMRPQPDLGIAGIGTEGEKDAQSYGFASADLGIAGIERTEDGPAVASTTTEVPADDSLPWDSILVWSVLILLAGTVTILDARRHPRASI